MLYDKEASWYPEYEDEILLFKAETEATHDDQFDGTSWLLIGLEKLHVDEEDSLTDDEEEFVNQQRQQEQLRGRSAVTGY